MSKRINKIKFLENNIKRILFSNDENIILIVFFLIIAIASIAIPRFRTLGNVLIVSRQFSLITIVAFGQGLVLITGGFDLSVGYIAALSNMTVGYLIVYQGWPIWLCVITAILVGTVCGLLNGLLVTVVKVNALIATLGSGWIYGGIILVTTGGWPIVGLADYKWFDYLGHGFFLKIPMPVWFMLIIGVILTIFLQKSIYGRFLYAVGGNDKASWIVGLNVPNLKMLAFLICGTLSGIAGVLIASRLGTSQVNAAVNWTLPSVAAAVIGGVALSGGKGKIYGVLVGSALLGVISNILVLIKVSSYWISLISGFVLILAVSVDALSRRSEYI